MVFPSRKIWIWHSTLGWWLGVVFILLLSSLFEAAGLNEFQFFLGLGIGGGVGLLQARLWRVVPGMFRAWLISTSLGMGLGFFALDLFFLIAEPSSANLLPKALTGACIAAWLQQRALQRQQLRVKYWWLGSFLAWAAGLFTVLSMDYLKGISAHHLVMFVVNLVLILGGGTVLGLVSAAFLPGQRS